MRPSHAAELIGVEPLPWSRTTASTTSLAATCRRCLKLHPYLRWETLDGRTIRGRRNVLAELESDPPAGPPRSYELRDEQIYRWIA